MAKKLIVVYDDTRKPNSRVRSITGGKSFGETIYKRVTLKERMKNYFESNEEVLVFVDSVNARQIEKYNNTPVILMYSDFVISDEEGMKILITKALYAHENYKVVVNDKVACVIYCDVDEYLKGANGGADAYNAIRTECLNDISDVMSFRQFITGGFEARFFNSLSGDMYTVNKSSDKIDKIKAEYTFYSLLPEEMKPWFVMPYNYREDENKATYSMQRYNMTDLAIRYVHGAISVDECDKLLDMLFYFLKQRVQKQVTHEEYERVAHDLYVKKVLDRTEQLKITDGFTQLEDLIRTQTGYSGIDAVVAEYIELYERIRAEHKFMDVHVVGHGDLCFSNILYSDEISLVKLIDPKGAMSEDDIYTDPYYDMAKLSHSICGHYDFYNSDRYEIMLDDELKAHLIVDADNRPYVELFKNKLSENGVDFKLIRIYEASLFLSMLPLHMDRPKKVFAFVLNAIAIIKSLEN